VAQDLGAPARQPSSIAHSVAEIEAALARGWAARRMAVAGAGASGEGEPFVAARSSVLNLVVVAGRRETAERCAATIEATAGRHPSRSLVLAALDLEGPPGLDATVKTIAIPTTGGATRTGAETIFVSVYGQAGAHLASIIVPLLVHDLPVALWWPGDPSFRSHRADRLLPMADRLIVDGSSWSGHGLDRLADLAAVAHRRRLLVSDFALLRQARWREALAAVYDLPDLRPHLRSVRSIAVEYSTTDEGDPAGLTNVVRPVYHVAWLASRLGMTVVEPMRRHPDGRRTATLRQGNHLVMAEWRPVRSGLPPGSTVRIDISSRRRGSDLTGEVTAGDLTVEVSVRDQGRERVRRSYQAPRLRDVDLLERAVEDNAGDPVAGESLAMAGRLIAVAAPRGSEKRGGS
jgi:glucose-6-phosphate dehydrogenase assembly protein OpcA